MDDKQLKQEHSTPADDRSDLDIGTLVEQIRNDLRGRVSRAIVRQALLEILPKYEKARIKTYVPILVRREALEILRGELSKVALKPSRSPGTLSADTPDGRTAKPYGLTTGIVLPENS